jgi:hypothetical protein
MSNELSENVAELLREGGLQLFSQGVQSEVEGLLTPGQTVEPDARERLVQAMQKGARHQPGREPLESLLFRVRRESQLNIASVARDAEMDPILVADLERGTAALRGQEAVKIASWIRSLRVDASDAIDSMRRSLSVSHSGVYASGDMSQHLNAEDLRFIGEVERLLRDPH